MHHRVDSGERAANQHRVADVSHEELDLGVEIRGTRPALPVHLRYERIQRAHTRAAREEQISEMGADESGAARDEDPLGAHGSTLRECAEPWGASPM